MPAVFELHHIVTARDLDDLGHVNNLEYIRWMLHAAGEHSAAQGWPGSRYLKVQAGWVVHRHEIEYRRPAFLNEHVVVRTWVVDMKRSTSLRRYQILLAEGERELAVASTNWAFIDFRTQRLARVLPEIANAFEVVPDPPPSFP
jgi:acyl-CoA thioester hydrolase